MNSLRRALALAGFVLTCGTHAEAAVVMVPETEYVDVTTSFKGADVKTFGVVDQPGDVIVKVTGPRQNVTIAREKQWGPFWIGGGKVDVAEAPSLLYVYSTKPVATVLSQAQRDKNGLTLEGVHIEIKPPALGKNGDDWRRAFFRLKEKGGHYVEDDHAVKVVRNRLVVSDISLPGDAQIGQYTIETLLVNGGNVVARDLSHFELRQTGIEAWIWNAAQQNAWTFGLACTLCAMMLGFVLNAVTHRS